MKKLAEISFVFISAVLFIFSHRTATAQNLVPNPGFETIASCPPALSSLGQLILATPWDPLNGTADLFNSCYVNGFPVGCTDVDVPFNFAGYSTAHGGNSYAGVVVKAAGSLREYISVALSSALMPGYPYRVEFYVRKATLARYAVKQIGASLSVGALFQPGTSNIPIVPDIESTVMLDDTTKWTLISAIYIATAGVDHITIGNFRDEAATNYIDEGNLSPCGLLNSGYYYIDDVSVTLINETLNITGDTIICAGQSTTLTAQANVTTYWTESGNPVPISSNPSVTVTPADTTTYLLNGVNEIDSVTVYVLNPPVVNLGPDTTVCENASYAIGASNVNATYLWSTGETTDTIYPHVTDTFWVHVDNGGCMRMDTAVVTVLTNPPIHLGFDPVIGGIDSNFCLNNYDTLQLDAGPGTLYLWLPALDTTRIFSVVLPGKYSVIVMHANGCTTTDSIVAYEICPPHIYVPKAFTPNGDLLNDYFNVMGTDIYSPVMEIYNRWGQLIYESHSSAVGWNGFIKGKPAPQGIYIYRVTYNYYNETNTLVSGEKTGTVALIR